MLLAAEVASLLHTAATLVFRDLGIGTQWPAAVGGPARGHIGIDARRITCAARRCDHGTGLLPLLHPIDQPKVPYQ